MVAAVVLSGCGGASGDDDAAGLGGSMGGAGAGTGGGGGSLPSGGAGGQGGFPPYPEPVMEGLIRGVDEAFWANMDDFVFNRAAPSNLELYVTLNAASHYLSEPHRALGMELVRHPESFFANAVIPFLERYGPSGVIWAVDCMNEPEAMVAGPDGNYESWGASWSEIRAYLRYCAETIHDFDPTIRVSAGSGWHDWDNIAAGRYLDLDFDFYDYHYYSDEPAVPDPSTLNIDRPIIIGECGQYTDVWDDDLQYEAVHDCFAGAKSAGYEAALSWYYNYAGSDNHHTHLNPDGSWRAVKDAFDLFTGDGELDVGLNLAWLAGAYGHDFGPSALYPTWSVAYEPTLAQEVVDDYQTAGIGIMRLWLFEGQEALPYHCVFDDFESGAAGWSVTDDDAMMLTTSQSCPHDGDFSLAVSVDATTAGWYGIRKTWADDSQLNLAPMSQWLYFVHNDLGCEVGVNLAFVTKVDGEQTTYQTRSGATGGQLWIGTGDQAVHAVSLAEDDFADQWALDDAPGQGVSRPAAEQLEQVEAICLRVHLSEAVVPVSGLLFVDAVRIR